MPLLTEQVWFNEDENAAVRRGLGQIVNRFAEMKFRPEYPPHMVFPNVIDKCPERAFDPEMANRMLRLWRRLTDTREQPRSKHRLDCFDVSAAAFSVRVGRGRKKKTETTAELERKLETYRKRCKRSILTARGDEEYRNLESRWQRFEQWLRYIVLPFRAPRRPSGVRALYQEQSHALMTIAKTWIAERCREHVEDSKLEHVMTLLKREVRRGRQPGQTIKGVAEGSEAAKTFIFEFIRKRFSPRLKYQFLSPCEQASERAEKFKAAMNLPEAEPVTLETVSPKKIADRIARLFKEHLHPDDWEAVKDQFTFMAGITEHRPEKMQAASFEEVVERTRPEYTTRNDRCKEINFAVDWLQKLLYAINVPACTAMSYVQSGYVAALNSSKT